jgi:glycogen(starch) synthase
VDYQYWSDPEPRNSDFFARAGMKPREEFILFVGRLDETKGLDTLVRAYARVSASGSKPRLVIAGPDYGAGPKIAHLAMKLGVLDQIVFTGGMTRESVRACYRSALITVVPSRYESFGIVALEAAAAGSPLIVSNTCGAAKVMRSVGGVVVNQGVDVLSSAISDLLASAAKRGEMKQRFRSIPWQEYDWGKVAKAMVAIYRSRVRHG